MEYTRQFEQYLAAYRQRLVRLVVARGAASLAIAALILSLLAVAAAVRAGFPDDFMVAARITLLGCLTGIGYYFLFVRRARVAATAAAAIEQRTPAFAGRVEAYVDTRDARNPMRELLAEQSMQLAERHTPQSQVPARELRTAWSAAGCALAVLLLVAVAGPGNYSFGVRDLWLGWAFPGLLPPQSIEVLPGDDGIRLGGTVRVRASMQGFDPVAAHVHARFGDGEWQQVPMSETADGFEFTFFSVRQPLDYYVSANNVRSPGYRVHVVDVPVLETLALTYHYPEWTAREPDLHDPGGDIRAIAGTEIELRITTDRPMTPGAVIVDDQSIPLTVTGAFASAKFTLAEDGQYYVAATVGGERIRLSDDYFITILDDQAPEIAVARPGRDWSASRIEEVTARVTAEDDFRVESLELLYSVNGAGWQSVALDTSGKSVDAAHVFFLESLVDEQGELLEPGDLVSYYALAKDRNQSARTDMFFIDVQPFDRRYSQSQQMGGGNQQGGPEDEVSQRQRQIIISTWNLIREQNADGRGSDVEVSDNAALLARLQDTLRGQVETLAQRSEARQLTASDEDIARFVEHLRNAAAAMVPAAASLAEIDLEEALLPEQEALQHLLAAEAVFTDINVSMQANRGGGGQAGRDLSEMFELEMDLEKNQYETGSRATPDAPADELQDAADELAELARRQEQLARNRDRARTPTPEQRWQQEMLRREVEELQRRLEQLQASRQQASTQSGQGQADRSAQAAQDTGEADMEQRNREIDELQRRLQSARRAMQNAADAMRQQGDPEAMRQSMEEAQRQLERAGESASQARQRAMQAAVSALVERADDLHDVQSALERTLVDAVRGAMQDRDSGDALDSGLTWQEEFEIAEEKRAMLAELQRLQSDAQATAQAYAEDDADAAEAIREGIDRVRDMEVEARIAVAAAYIEQGEAVYVVSSESAVTEALRRLRDDLARANDMTAASTGGRRGDNGQLRATLAEARELRRSLQQAAGESGRGGIRAGGPEGTDRDVATGLRVDDLELAPDLGRQARALAQSLLDTLQNASEAGLDTRDIDELRRLAADVRAADFSGNPEVLARETSLALALVEQVELQLARAVGGDAAGVRGDSGAAVPDQHREIIADYYRRLGRSEQDEAR